MRHPTGLLFVVVLLPLHFIAAGFAWGQNSTSVEFRLPQGRKFRFDEELAPARGGTPVTRWLRGQADDGSTNSTEFGDQVVVELAPGTTLGSVMGAELTLSRSVTSNVFILQAAGAAQAAREAGRIASIPGVTASYPVMRQEVSLDGLYAARPNDPHFVPLLFGVTGQWNLENRDQTNGMRLGPDLNVRGAWPYARGEGITIAIGDTGIEVAHPDLTNRAAGAPHRNFSTGVNSATPFAGSATWAHGTECAGLAAAESENSFGMAGVAPRSHLAGWVIFTNNSSLRLAGDDKLMDMFQYASNVVSVQSHSWTHNGLRLMGLTTLENIGIESAIRNGRNGRGVVMVRPAGNDRQQLASPNDDAYCSDPRVIAVGSVARTGRVTSYSERGSSVLVAAPSGESGGPGMFTTDLLGTAGAMFVSYLPPLQYLSDFAFNGLGFSGTSASVPQVAGVAALILSANTNLSYRDVQQILLLSSRHFDGGDPDLTLNGAGLLVSHNDGFGIPDAGRAVKMARSWTPRSAIATITATVIGPLPIPDDGLRLRVSGLDVPANIASIRCLPAAGPHPDTATPPLRMVDLGLATNVVLPDLRGKGALIERGTNNFDEKIIKAALAGAEFAVIYNFQTNRDPAGCPGGDQLCLMGNTDFTPIPAIFIGRTDGLALKQLIATNSMARGQLSLTKLTVRFPVDAAVVCEQVGVRLKTDHPLRGDLRVTLVSPAGTRSVLQQFNSDTAPGPIDWTYWSTHHFFESSVGEWRLEVSDEGTGASGNLLSGGLILLGVPIEDADGDGLDDGWEMVNIGSMDFDARDDLDEDGYNNAMEQAMGTDPLTPNEALRQDLVLWDAKLARLSWPAVDRRTYEILAGPNPSQLTLLTNVPGLFPESEWFTPITNATSKFFRVREKRP
ncbi:MAG: hypothetical protein QOF48_2198 [Verrucomicrobiota bacterium]|jgi:subtilisin family serine protease/subtilisin-like proprotein convertase family protein